MKIAIIIIGFVICLLFIGNTYRNMCKPSSDTEDSCCGITIEYADSIHTISGY